MACLRCPPAKVRKHELRSTIPWMIRSVALSLAFLLSMAVTKSSRAEAQGDDTVAAREAFVAGAAAAEEGRWADSLEEFQRAYLLTRRA